MFFIELLKNKEVMNAIVDTVTLLITAIIYKRQSTIKEGLKK